MPDSMGTLPELEKQFFRHLLIEKRIGKHRNFLPPSSYQQLLGVINSTWRDYGNLLGQRYYIIMYGILSIMATECYYL